MAIAQKLGRCSADVFKKDDLVVAQNSRTVKWTVRGRIIKTRTAEDGTVRSFEVKTESGTTTLRNARHLRHQTKKMQVRWAADGATKRLMMQRNLTPAAADLTDLADLRPA